MIHDAKVEVTCDGPRCISSVDIDLHFVYHSMSGRSGQYDHDDESVEKLLVQEDWIVSDDHKHYCCEWCAKAGEAEQ